MCHGRVSQLKSKAGEAADINGGALVKELQDSKNKAPYVQPGPVRATPDILNLDEPGKVIREVTFNSMLLLTLIHQAMFTCSQSWRGSQHTRRMLLSAGGVPRSQLANLNN